MSTVTSMVHMATLASRLHSWRVYRIFSGISMFAIFNTSFVHFSANMMATNEQRKKCDHLKWNDYYEWRFCSVRKWKYQLMS